MAALASQVFAEGAKLANQIEQTDIVEFLGPVYSTRGMLPNRAQLLYRVDVRISDETGRDASVSTVTEFNQMIG